MSQGSRFQAALDRVLALVVFLDDDMTRALARDGLTTSRAHLIWELVQRGPSTQRALADAMGISARTVTGLTDGLVETGFVTREKHPSDRRAALVTLTAHGQAIAERLQRDQRTFSHDLFAGMPRTQFDGFVVGLDHVLARLRELSARATAGTSVKGDGDA
jgi:DNA-binding MarR family transcriptional regulator